MVQERITQKLKYTKVRQDLKSITQIKHRRYKADKVIRRWHFITPYDLEQLDFYINGFSSKYSGETNIFNYTKDGSGKITELITEDVVIVPVNWHGSDI